VLHDIAASRIAATSDDVDNASLDILSRSVAEWKYKEANIVDLTQKLIDAKARNLITKTKSAHDAVNMADQLEQQRHGEIQVKLKVSCEKKTEQHEKKLEQSTR
jgi:hypothetical protein